MKSKILDLNFAGDPQEVIEKYWETIEHYRSQGKTLPQIYTALSKKDGFEDSLSFASFKGHYYRQRRLKRSGEAKRDPVTINEVAEITPPSRKSMKSGKISKPSGEIQSPELSVSSNQATPSLDAVEKADPEPEAKKSVGEFKRLEIGGTLEQRRAIARAHFNQS